MSIARRLRAPLLTLALTLVVGAFGAVFAHLFREAIFFTLDHVAGDKSSTRVAQDSPRWVVFVVVTSGLLVAAWIGRVAVRRRHERLGLAAVADAARGSGTGPSVQGTLLRSSGTFVAMSSLASLGREAAILETGGSFGAWLGRTFRRQPADLAVTGIAASFASAYHAPIGAVLYVREHVVNRPERRIVACALAGAVIGQLVSVHLLGGKSIFARGIAPLGAGAFVRAGVALVPALLATKLFFALRQRVTPVSTPTSESARVWLRSSAFAVVGGITVAAVPLASGNGMEAIRLGLTGATIGLALALLVGKIVATTAALGSGAPGGVFAPSMAVAAGAALLCFETLDRLGVSLPGSHWDGMLAAMSVGIAVGTKTPLVGVVVVAELAGDARLLPVCAASVVGATLLELAMRSLRPTALERKSSHPSTLDD